MIPKYIIDIIIEEQQRYDKKIARLECDHEVTLGSLYQNGNLDAIIDEEEAYQKAVQRANEDHVRRLEIIEVSGLHLSPELLREALQ